MSSSVPAGLPSTIETPGSVQREVVHAVEQAAAIPEVKAEAAKVEQTVAGDATHIVHVAETDLQKIAEAAAPLQPFQGLVTSQLLRVEADATRVVKDAFRAGATAFVGILGSQSFAQAEGLHGGLSILQTAGAAFVAAAASAAVTGLPPTVRQAISSRKGA